MKTNFGHFLRKIRLDHNEILKDMAERLGVSSAFLSAVENGKKKIPSKWPQKLAALYGLDPEQIEGLKTAIAESEDVLEVDVRNAPGEKRRLAVSFARQFDTMDDDTVQKISRLLKKNNK